MGATLGFVGLGQMGGAMARRLIAAGNRVVGFDPDSAAMEQLAAAGLIAAASAREVADAAPIVFACLPSGEASLEVAHGIRQGAAVRVLVECSTIGGPAMQAVAAAVQARGIDVLDAPVSGGPKGADAGTLAVIVSGSPAAVGRARPALDQLAGSVMVVGDTPGQAQTCKLVNNAISLSTMLLTCEAVVMGVKAGVDAGTLIDVINVSSGRSSASADKFPKAVLPRSFDYGGAIGLGNKDFELFVQQAHGLGLPAELVAHAANLWRCATVRVGEKADYAAVVRLFEEWAGVECRRG